MNITRIFISRSKMSTFPFAGSIPFSHPTPLANRISIAANAPAPVDSFAQGRSSTPGSSAKTPWPTPAASVMLQLLNRKSGA
jgi:hypothetical protein